MSPLPRFLRAVARPALRIPFVRRLREGARDAILRRRLRRTLSRLSREAGPDRIDLELLGAVREAWGNPGWTADLGFLAEVARRALIGDGPFLDCGSGLSTLVAGALAGPRGVEVWSLEQDRDWYWRMAELLPALELERVTLWHAPLVPYGGFVWFDLRERELPPFFDAIFCDGPAVLGGEWTEEQTRSWRRGVVPVLRNLGISFGEIVLDDEEDPRCAGLVESWEGEGLETRVVTTPWGSLVVARPSAVDA